MNNALSSKCGTNDEIRPELVIKIGKLPKINKITLLEQTLPYGQIIRRALL